MKIKPIASLIAVTAATLGFMAPARADVNLFPNTEGEVDLDNKICIDAGQCLSLDLFPFVASIFSEDGSRLFVDDLSTESTYGDIVLGTVDAGTNPLGYWLRPSNDAENGLLETGTFTFNFTETLKKLSIDFFDTETDGTTGVLALNGAALDPVDWVSKGGNSNIATQTFYDVDSITMKLGGPRPGWKYGDGVSFRVAADVPEPATLSGLAVVGLAFAGRKLRKGSKA
jgi:hypothetical protein